MLGIFDELRILSDNEPEKAVLLATSIKIRLEKLLKMKKEFLKKAEQDDFVFVSPKVQQLLRLGEVNDKLAKELEFYDNLTDTDKQIMEFEANKNYRENLMLYQSTAQDLNNFLVDMNMNKICANSCADMSNILASSKNILGCNVLEYALYMQLNTVTSLSLLSGAAMFGEVWKGTQKSCEMLVCDSLDNCKADIKSLSKKIMHDAYLIKYYAVLDGKDDACMVYKTAHLLRTAMSNDAFNMLRNNNREQQNLKSKLVEIQQKI